MEALVAVCSAVAVTLCVVLAVIDVREHRLPNPLVAALAFCGLAVGVTRVVGDDLPVAWLLFGFVGFGAPFLLINLIRPAALGFGDVKLAFALGLFFGSFAPGAVPVGLALVAVAQLGLWLVLGPRVVPFGPVLVGAAAFCVGPPMYDYLIGI